MSDVTKPTWVGYVENTMDALIIIEACLQGRLSHVSRRPHDTGDESPIRSGGVFVYEEHSSGIKRWTDGCTWSPSRILTNFLIYRELVQPFPPGEKKKAIKKGKSNGTANAGVDSAGPSSQHDDEDSEPEIDPDPNNELRPYVGSLIDSYNFKPGGLVKKTISLTYKNMAHHLVAYYTVEDARSGRFITPCMDPQLHSYVPRSALFTDQHFRFPIEQENFVTDMPLPMQNLPGLHLPNQHGLSLGYVQQADQPQEAGMLLQPMASSYSQEAPFGEPNAYSLSHPLSPNFGITHMQMDGMFGDYASGQAQPASFHDNSYSQPPSFHHNTSYSQPPVNGSLHGAQYSQPPVSDPLSFSFDPPF